VISLGKKERCSRWSKDSMLVFEAKKHTSTGKKNTQKVKIEAEQPLKNTLLKLTSIPSGYLT